MRLLTCTIFLLLAFYMQAQSAAEDTVLARLMHISNDTQRMSAYLDYADRELMDHPKEIITIGKILFAEATAHGKLLQAAMADKMIAEGYEVITDYPKSLQFYLDALRIHKDQKEYRLQISDMLGIARVYEITDDTTSEKKTIEDAMAITRQHLDNEKVRKKLPLVMDYLATIYKKEKRYDTAIRLYNDAIAMARNEGNKLQQLESLCNLAIALKSTKQYDASLATYKQALALIDSSDEGYAESVIYANLAILFYDMNDLLHSEQYALKAIYLQNKFQQPGVLKDLYETLLKIYTKQKKYPEALDYSVKLSAIKDSILNKEKSQQLKLLQVKFDSDDKDRQIAGQEKALKYNRRLNILLVLSSALFLMLGIFVYRNLKTQRKYNAALAREKQRSEDLLLNILPAEVAEELKETGVAAARHFDNVTVLFTDFVNFTHASEFMTPQQLIDELHFCFKAFDDIIGRHNIEKIKTIGDSYLAVSGMPAANLNHAENIIDAALEINAFINARKQQLGDTAFEMRTGIHSGSVVAGIVGVKKFSYDIWGDTVNTAARMEQTSEAGKINISQTTYELVKDKFRCTYRGEVEAKNKGLLKMYFVEQ